MSSFKDITIKENAEIFLNKLDRNSLLIYSETSMKKINFTNENTNKINWHDISKNISDINCVINNNDKTNQVVSFGGGSVIDIAKYVSYKMGVRHVCIPSMLSTNSYATNKVALIDGGNKLTMDAKLPDCVILDCNLLRKSVTENLYGLADVLSIYTASQDWKIASKDINENMDEDIYKMSSELLCEVLDFISNNSLDEISNNIEQLYDYIGVSGHITNLYGTGRPESGSEHIFAKKMESKLDVPHGIAVSFGIILMSITQEMPVDNIINAIKKIQVLDASNLYGVNNSIIEESFMSLIPRKDRYTIIDRVYGNNNYKSEKLKIFHEKYN